VLCAFSICGFRRSSFLSRGPLYTKSTLVKIMAFVARKATFSYSSTTSRESQSLMEVENPDILQINFGLHVQRWSSARLCTLEINLWSMVVHFNLERCANIRTTHSINTFLAIEIFGEFLTICLQRFFSPLDQPRDRSISRIQLFRFAPDETCVHLVRCFYAFPLHILTACGCYQRSEIINANTAFSGVRTLAL
jgi:hypothetical protein